MELLKTKNGMKLVYMAVAVALGLGLIFMGGSGSQENIREEEELMAYRTELEERLEAICRPFCDEVVVYVTFFRGYEYVYATDSRGGVVTIGSGSEEKPLVEEVRLPLISGVSIVCKKPMSKTNEKKIISLVSSALNIGTNKIFVIS